jgi:hypothetical protein
MNAQARGLAGGVYCGGGCRFGTALALALTDLASTVIVSWPAEVRKYFFALIARLKLARLHEIGGGGRGRATKVG